jgi:hypothetical protein
MLSIERSLEVALRQFHDIAQTQRELDVAELLRHATRSATGGGGGGGAHAAGAPLAVVAKIERALAFGLRAVGQVVLFDSETTEELSTMSFGLPSSDALATAHAYMAPDAAEIMEAVLQAFLKNSVAARRKAIRRVAAGHR